MFTGLSRAPLLGHHVGQSRSARVGGKPLPAGEGVDRLSLAVFYNERAAVGDLEGEGAGPGSEEITAARARHPDAAAARRRCGCGRLNLGFSLNRSRGCHLCCLQ